MLTISEMSTNIPFEEKDYYFEVQKLIEYIIKIKEEDRSISILDGILDYCNRYDIPEELIGDAISTDVYFKDLIKKDCEFHNYIKIETPEDW